MALELKVKHLDIDTGSILIAVLNAEDAAELGVWTMDRVEIASKKRDGKPDTAIVDITRELVKPGEIGFFKELQNQSSLKQDELVIVHPSPAPASLGFVKSRLMGNALSPSQMHEIVKDIAENRLSDVECSFFIASTYVHDFSDEETYALTKAMVDTGSVLDFGKPVVDKHCIGGIPGNRTTMIVVPIVAAAGATIPKTSSRAISSASGTADTMEVLAPVNLSLEKIKEVVQKTNACIVWGGSVNLVPVDDILNQLRYSLRLDPEPFLLSSVLGKKKSVGAKMVVIDIPVGREAKVPNVPLAKKLASKFVDLGAKLGMEVHCLITAGENPVGHGIGPALEARDVLRVLSNTYDGDLKEKSLSIAGIMLEMADKAKAGEGYALADSILKSGKALEKMNEIILVQGGKPVNPEDIKVGPHAFTVVSKKQGTIYDINNTAVTKIARAAGAPKDKTAGVYMKSFCGQNIKMGDPILEIYAAHPAKLEEAKALASQLDIVRIERPIIGIIDQVHRN